VSVDLSDATAVAELLDRAAAALRDSSLRAGSCLRLPRRGRLVVTGDLHDNPIHFERIQAFAHLDRPDHHLILHELIHGDRLVNGVDLSYRILVRVAMLVLEHPDRVHPVLANHELAQAFRQSVSKGAGDNVALFDAGVEWAFGDDAVQVEDAIARFVRAMPLALRCENGSLVAHSLPGPHAMKRFDPGVLDRELHDGDYLPNAGAAWLMVWGRGQTREQLEELAARWNVRMFFTGHSHVPTGIEAAHPMQVILNSDHEHAMVLPLDLAADPPSAEQCVFEAIPVASLGAAR
jgi:hypothetical protein